MAYSQGKSETSKSIRLQPMLLGEMAIHSDSVNTLLPITEASFASCSSDGLVILWKVLYLFIYNNNIYYIGWSIRK
jgi:hypothetical protein